MSSPHANLRMEGALNDVAWSIVVPTYRRPRAVAAAVESALRLDPPPGGFEVVVVDDGGGDVPDDLGRLPGVRLLRQPNAGPAAARNTGARDARGRFVAFLDDDCRPDARWLVELDRALGGKEDAIAGGRTRNALRHSTWAAASQDLVDAIYRRANGGPGGARFFTSNNLGLSAASFRNAGGFDAAFRFAGGEDRAFCRAWLESGRAMIDAPEALVWHHHDMDARGFWRQHFRYGRGARRFYETAEAGELRERGALGAAGFALEAVLQPLRSENPGRRVRRSLALVAAQAATAAGSLAEARSIRRAAGRPKG